MEDPFPLSLPTGTSAISLPWRDRIDQAWIVEATEVEGHKSTWKFGKTTFGRHLCLHRFKLWWLKPSHGHSGLNVPPETALLLAERHRPPFPSPSNICSTAGVPPLHPQKQHRQLEYVVLLPVSDTRARASLHRAGGSTAGTPSSSSSSPSSSETVLEHDPSALAVSADTGDAATLLPGKLGVLLVATGPDPFRLVRGLVREATERLRAQLLTLSLEEGRGSAAVAVAVAGVAGVARDGVASAAEGGGSVGGGCGDGPREALAASFVDTFGWCTWDSFYTMVTPEGVLEGLSTLRQGGVRPRWVVLDDGWQSTTNDDALNAEQWDERLVKFEANKRFRRFDEEGVLVLDLGDTVKKMKKDFEVDQVLAWHAMTGYWAGVEPEAPEMAAFNPHVTALSAPKGIREVDPEMQPELDEKRFGMVKPSHAESFYSAYHKYLKENGVDGVKVDAQSILDCTGGGNGGVPAVARAYHEGLCRSVQAAFKEGEKKPAALIHCMCHAPSVLFLIACVSQDRVVLRGSDDFYPREQNSHGPHLYANAFNALLLSNLGIQDWDMFQTGLGLEGAGKTAATGAQVEGGPAPLGEGPASWFHAAARAISGGPVYVSDRPGQHNGDILGRLVLDDGSVLRASTNALPTLDCLFRDPQQDGGGLLQVWALNALPGTGVVGSFNIQGASFSQSERTWVRHRDDPGDDEDDDDAPAAGGAGVKGTVSPSDVHAFLRKKPSTIPSKGCAALTEAGRSPPGGGRAEDSRSRERDDDAGEGNKGSDTAEADGCCFAVYLHRRRETRVVGLREAVGVEVLPLSYELATFSRIVDLRASPSAAAAATDTATTTATAAAAAAAAGAAACAGKAKATAAAAAATESRKAAGPAGAGVVRWAALGLPAMFNSSAAVTAQATTETTGGAFAPQRRQPLSRREDSDDAGLNRGGAVAGVSLTVKGSGTFLAVASRKPASARLYGGPGGGGDASEGGGAGEERQSGDDDDGGGGGGGIGGGSGSGAGVGLQVSFSALSSWEEESTAAVPEGGGAGTGGGGARRGVGLVEVDLPGPWDGRERRLEFRWVFQD